MARGFVATDSVHFLIAVPVKSFDSGDSNRDLHMVQVTKGAEFPMVTVRTGCLSRRRVPVRLKPIWKFSSPGRLPITSRCRSEPKTEGKEKHITGTIPATLADFKIEPPRS